jgi:organic hydroperoxide reductase OsmC/OhrA
MLKHTEVIDRNVFNMLLQYVDWNNEKTFLSITSACFTMLLQCVDWNKEKTFLSITSACFNMLLQYVNWNNEKTFLSLFQHVLTCYCSM